MKLTPLETELLAIVRSMSSKLHEAADFLDKQHPNSINDACMAADCRTYAEYSVYMKEFPVMEQYGYK